MGAIRTPAVVRTARGEDLKVLHLTPSFFPASYYGGPIRSSLALCTELARLGCDVRVLTTNANGPRIVAAATGEEVTLNGFRVMYCARLMEPDLAPSLLWRLPFWIRWADIVHITGVFSYPTPPGLAASVLLKRPVVWTPRGALQSYGLKKNSVLKHAWLAACSALSPGRIALHVTSEEERADAAKVLPSMQAAVIANGVEIPEPVVRPKRADALRLLFLGRLHPVKGLENLLAACSALPSVTLTIAGNGDPKYVKTLRQLTGQLHISDRVVFAGEVLGHVKRHLMNTSDVMVMPSHSENFGMSVAEALAAGMPVIASRGTPWSKVEEVGCGLWVSNTPESLATAIHQMDRMPLDEMGARGRAWIESEFTWQPRALAMIALYHDLLRPIWQPDAPQSSTA